MRNLIFDEYIGRTLVMDTDKGQITCSVLVVFKTEEDAEQRYIALLALENNEVSDNLYLYRFDEDENGPALSNIESDLEYQAVTNVLGEYLDKLDEEKMHHHDHDHDHDCGCSCSCSGGCGSGGCH